RMPVTAVTIYVIADLVEHSRSRKPFAILWWQTVHGLQTVEKLHRGIADLQGMADVYPVVLDGGLDRITALGLDLVARGCAAVLGRHFGQSGVGEFLALISGFTAGEKVQHV